MLTLEEQTLLLHAVQQVEDQLIEQLEAAVASVRADAAAAVSTAGIIQTDCGNVRRRLDELRRPDRLYEASLSGDAYVITDLWPDGRFVVPDRVQGAPTLVLQFSLYPGETPPEKARDHAEQRGGPPMVIRGQLAGMKELVCRAMHAAYAQVTGHG